MSQDQSTRRRFLRRAAGTFAAPFVVTSKALGKVGGVPASERVAIGHIGVGNRGGGLLGYFLNLPDCRCVAVCDPFESRRTQQAKRVDDHYAKKDKSVSGKGCAAYRDFRELIARDDIDAVVIATPDHWHVPIAVAAAREGKDLYVEKPLGLSIEQDLTLRETVNRYRRVFQYGTQQRSTPLFRHACELVRNGRIGKVHTINVWCPSGEQGGSTKVEPPPADLDYDMWLGPAPQAPYTADRCSARGAYWVSDYALGFVAGWGAHPLDIAQWGNDTDDTGPIEYEGRGVFPTDGLYDTAISWDVHCLYANGVKMRFMSPDAAAPIATQYGLQQALGTMFIGDKGWIDVDRTRMYADPPSLLNETIAPDELHLYESNHHWNDFISAVKTRSGTVSPIEVAVRGDTISQLSEIAIRTGRKITWDPGKETLVGDETASRMLTRAMRSPWRL
ncbi:MAG: Gfo/Idh/MocA family oxidoreductase [Phycisphaerae bacterium]|nr:Gfo/Idh/MocA family oxidoreductase [Phycisphaerae bacterium]